jgi:glycosyltransferase involved in cell wall biosynthesis
MTRKLGWDPRKLVLIPNRIDFSEYGQPFGGSDTSESFQPGRRDIPRLMYMSRLDREKEDAVLQFLEFAKHLNQRGIPARIQVVGDGQCYDRICSEVKKLNESARCGYVVMLGRRRDVPALLADCDVFFGFGRSALEAMAMGKATVITGTRGIAGVVTRRNAADLMYYNFSGRNISDHNRVQDEYTFVEKLIEDEDLRTSLGRFAQEFVRKHYDIENGVDRVLEVYGKARETYFTPGNHLFSWYEIGRAGVSSVIGRSIKGSVGINHTGSRG